MPLELRMPIYSNFQGHKKKCPPTFKYVTHPCPSHNPVYLGSLCNALPIPRKRLSLPTVLISYIQKYLVQYIQSKLKNLSAIIIRKHPTVVMKVTRRGLGLSNCYACRAPEALFKMKTVTTNQCSQVSYFNLPCVNLTVS